MPRDNVVDLDDALRGILTLRRALSAEEIADRAGRALMEDEAEARAGIDLVERALDGDLPAIIQWLYEHCAEWRPAIDHVRASEA